MRLRALADAPEAFGFESGGRTESSRRGVGPPAREQPQYRSSAGPEVGGAPVGLAWGKIEDPRDTAHVYQMWRVDTCVQASGTPSRNVAAAGNCPESCTGRFHSRTRTRAPRSQSTFPRQGASSWRTYRFPLGPRTHTDRHSIRPPGDIAPIRLPRPHSTCLRRSRQHRIGSNLRCLSERRRTGSKPCSSRFERIPRLVCTKHRVLRTHRRPYHPHPPSLPNRLHRTVHLIPRPAIRLLFGPRRRTTAPKRQPVEGRNAPDVAAGPRCHCHVI